jgi:hypothetical protein
VQSDLDQTLGFLRAEDILATRRRPSARPLAEAELDHRVGGLHNLTAGGVVGMPFRQA